MTGAVAEGAVLGGLSPGGAFGEPQEVKARNAHRSAASRAPAQNAGRFLNRDRGLCEGEFDFTGRLR